MCALLQQPEPSRAEPSRAELGGRLVGEGEGGALLGTSKEGQWVKGALMP